MQGNSEETADQNKRKNSYENSTVFEIPARKAMLSNDDCDTKEALNCMKTLTEIVSKRDDFAVYGEHIANKLRSSGRSLQEISIAQLHIEQICFSLVMGAYSRNNTFGPQNYSQYSSVPQNP
jgi:hypothetical protein